MRRPCKGHEVGLFVTPPEAQHRGYNKKICDPDCIFGAFVHTNEKKIVNSNVAFPITNANSVTESSAIEQKLSLCGIIWDGQCYQLKNQKLNFSPHFALN